MSDFNYGRSRGLGSYQDSQQSGYSYQLARERCMPERPVYGRNLETSEDYRYSNPPNNYEPQRTSGFQNNDDLRFNQTFANERIINSHHSVVPSSYSRDIRISNSRDLPERNYYNPSEPTGDNSYSGIPRVTSNNTFTNRVNSFQPTYDNQASSGAPRYIPPPPVPPVYDNQLSRAAPRYIPPPPAPPPIADFSKFTDQDMSLLRNIIQNIKTTNPTPANPPTTHNPRFAQSTSFNRDDRATSNIPRFSRDNSVAEYAPITSNIPRFARDNTVDEYAPIISSSMRTPVILCKIGNTTSGDRPLVNKPLLSKTFFNSGMAVSDIALLAAQYKSSTTKNRTGGQERPRDSRSDRGRDMRSDRALNSISDKSRDNRSDRLRDSRSDRAPNSRSDRASNSRTDRKRDSRSDGPYDRRSDRPRDSRPAIVSRPKKFEKRKGPNKRPFDTDIYNTNRDEVPSKRKKQLKPKKSRGNKEDYDDGWNDIRKEKVKFKDLFPIQAQKIYALMLRMETPIDIPETIIKDAPKDASINLQEEERLNQEFHQRREEQLQIAEKRTAKKREKRRRRRENKRKFVKNVLGMK